MDLPTADIAGSSILAALLIAALSWMGNNAVGWISDVNDTVETTADNKAAIVDMADDVKVIREIVTEDHALTAATAAEVQIVKEITLKNQGLGQAYKERLEQDQ